MAVTPFNTADTMPAGVEFKRDRRWRERAHYNTAGKRRLGNAFADDYGGFER